MGLALDNIEQNILHGLLEEASDDIVIRLNASGFIAHASANIAQLGEDLTSQLLMPHICDLSDPDYSDMVAAYSEHILSGKTREGAVEFPIIVTDDEEAQTPIASRRWYSLNLRPILDAAKPVIPAETNGLGKPVGAQVIGAVGLLRSVQNVRLLEGELHSRAVTDPLTGLSNRHAFCASMRRQIANCNARIVMVFAVDRMRSMFLQYGQRTSDEIQWGFAKFLEAMVPQDFELAQLDQERFAIMTPDTSITSAREWAQDVLDTFSSLAIPSSSRSPQLSASAGLARLESTVDWTLRQAELALVIARAGGGGQVGQCDYQGPVRPDTGSV